MSLNDYLWLAIPFCFLLAITIALRKPLRAWIVATSGRIWWIQAPEALLTAILPMMYIIFRPFEKPGDAQFQHPYPWVRPAFCVLLNVFVFLKIFILLSKDEISRIKKDLEDTSKMLDLWARLDALVGRVIKRKAERFEQYLTNSDKSSSVLTKLRNAIDPHDQIKELLKQAWGFFTTKDEQYRLRISIYHVRRPDDAYLARFFGWDGKSEDCYSNETVQLPRMSGPAEQPLTAVAELYSSHSDQALRIISDTAKEAEIGKFCFFREDQRKNVRSMIVYKVKYIVNNKAKATIIEMDCDQVDRFTEDNRRIYEQFFSVIGKRIAFEFLLSEVVRKAQKNGTNAGGEIKPAEVSNERPSKT